MGTKVARGCWGERGQDCNPSGTLVASPSAISIARFRTLVKDSAGVALSTTGIARRLGVHGSTVRAAERRAPDGPTRRVSKLRS
jgi:hypothetical protein